ncbi:bifunctional 4-hydroxy-2-oxoglutarate aldolase/2-dehydro-3-deoxy-phosphogluconate aldolase [Streptomyces marincola]|uniref:bifunctional 4-hydroxy-2-oxoglutarate aldolase/2-dehydro-3-deoxy-phosphogluconate aldolase n=1 Tax=Streptomyces marincola TaxID=2878388 RepID=UPI001CF4C8FD|nr:bifunctional 4-hydroxy-2-oxoglutarate aldolase/2-dehydro-3-deoxy-phosphogluconate aldolase [Streptomyces marincola]UCM86723.1 bifunctional 4-hydroxy-2-oxoglutarate aldolase/2-dehydro-3-deoxy-phosphogluconate aldolase [Streptomyces marincola]
MTDFFARAFAAGPVMGIFRGYDVPRTVDTCARAWDLGIELVEVTVQDRAAMDSLRAAVAAGRERGRVVGAGTVTSVEQVAEVAEAGAAFTVAPGLLPEVAAACRERGLPHLPGVATATEVSRARALGLMWQKAFPAAQLGAGWIRALRGPFPDVSFVATGGLDAHTAGDFLSAGCRAVAVGSALDDPAQLPLLAELMKSSS